VFPILGRSGRLLSAPGEGLRMAVGAEKSEVLESVVQPLTVDVVDDKPQGLALPCAVEPAEEAALLNAAIDQRTAELRSVEACGAGWKHDEHVLSLLPRRLTTAVMRLPEEVAGVDPGAPNPACQVRVLPAGRRDAKPSKHAGDRCRHGNGRSKVGVAVDATGRLVRVRGVHGPSSKPGSHVPADARRDFDAQPREQVGHAEGLLCQRSDLRPVISASFCHAVMISSRYDEKRCEKRGCGQVSGRCRRPRCAAEVG
jgi:hypothetical protein